MTTIKATWKSILGAAAGVAGPIVTSVAHVDGKQAAASLLAAAGGWVVVAVERFADAKDYATDSATKVPELTQAIAAARAETQSVKTTAKAASDALAAQLAEAKAQAAKDVEAAKQSVLDDLRAAVVAPTTSTTPPAEPPASAA